jgi:hypothetical protein
LNSYMHSNDLHQATSIKGMNAWHCAACLNIERKEKGY